MGPNHRHLSGIGLAFARELARRGRRVLAVARLRERLEAWRKRRPNKAVVSCLWQLTSGRREGLALEVERNGRPGWLNEMLVFLNRFLPRGSLDDGIQREAAVAAVRPALTKVRLVPPSVNARRRFPIDE